MGAVSGAAVGRHVFLPWARKNEPKGRFDQKLPLIVWVFVSFWSNIGGIVPKPTQSSRFFGEIRVLTEIWVVGLRVMGAVSGVRGSLGGDLTKNCR
jgi:hypothetical protein